MEQITEQKIKTLLSVVDAGLVYGMGTPTPGLMCVEAAVCYALSLPHGDDPKCVGRAVRGFKISLNDSDWSSRQARAAGMRKLAVAQLGSDTLDQQKFTEYLLLQTIKRVLPILLRFAKLEVEALSCEKVETLEQAKVAIKAVAMSTASITSWTFAACSAYSVITYIDKAVKVLFAGFSGFASNCTVVVARLTIMTANIAVNATNKVEGDTILQLSAQIGLEALQAQNSPGCKWLYLCD